MKKIQNAQLLVIKVGSSLVTANGCGIDYQRLDVWAKQIVDLMQHGKKIVLISSGAIAEGIKRLGWTSRPKALNQLQAAAAVGQMGLAQAYEQVFAQYGVQTAQILLTHDDLKDRTRYLNARSTLKTLINMGVVPIINENDTVATSEIKLGDNDTLGALVTNLIEADALLILTDQSGLYDQDPRQNPQAQLIATISVDDPRLESMAGGSGSSVGTGGMYTKVMAAKRAALSGAVTLIASGVGDDVLLRATQGENMGSLLYPVFNRINGRQQWLMGQLTLAGQIIIDDGAADALLNKNSSLLAIGCAEVMGVFQRGEAVAIITLAGKEIARGLVNYRSDEITKLCRMPSNKIEQILSYVAEEEIIHRDNMVIQSKKTE